LKKSDHAKISKFINERNKIRDELKILKSESLKMQKIRDLLQADLDNKETKVKELLSAVNSLKCGLSDLEKLKITVQNYEKNMRVLTNI